MIGTKTAVRLKTGHAKWMYDYWIKDHRIKQLDSVLQGKMTDSGIELVKKTVAYVLADQDVHTVTLKIRSSNRRTRCKIDAKSLSDAGVKGSHFCGVVQGTLRRIREGAYAEQTDLSEVNKEGILTFTYKA